MLEDSIVRCGTFLLMFSIPLKTWGHCEIPLNCRRCPSSHFLLHPQILKLELNAECCGHKPRKKPGNKPILSGLALPTFVVTLGIYSWIFSVGLPPFYHNSHGHVYLGHKILTLSMDIVSVAREQFAIIGYREFDMTHVDPLFPGWQMAS